jgi:arylsulfatase A-like enzyme/Flp pilus assembly protein TadD
MSGLKVSFVTGFVKAVRWRVVLVCGLVAAGAAGLWLWRAVYRRPGHIRNVVLISIDTCRADYLSCYGYPRQTTPNIDRLAGRGTIFANVVSPVPITLPAHCSMLTGVIPPGHGVHNNVRYKLAESYVTLPEILRSKGFTTAAIVGAFVLDSQFGLDQGFDTYNDQFEESRDNVFGSDRPGGEVSRFALQWLNGHRNDRFFLFLHYYDPHTEYTPPEPFASKFADNPYAGEIAYADHCIGLVLERLKELRLYDSTLIVIVGDHGEMLGEHDEKEHGYFIYESAIRIPLIFKLPGQTRGQTVHQMAGLIDITPTICGLLGVPIPAGLHGQDLSGYLRQRPLPAEERYFYCESLMATRFDANPLLGVTTGRWKYIHTTRPELYDLFQDPHETTNLVTEQVRQAQLLREFLEQTLQRAVSSAGADSEISLDSQSLARLESLGYAGDIQKTFILDQSKRDPKDLVTVHGRLQQAIKLMYEGKCEQAKPILEQLLVEQPDLRDVHTEMGRLAARLDDIDGAVRHYRRAVEIPPANSTAYNNLGVALTVQGGLDQAIEQFAEAIRIDPANIAARNNLASCLARRGRLEEAVNHYHKALELDPRNAAVYFNLAMILRRQDKLEEAVSCYLKGLQIAPADTNARNNLAETLAIRGRLAEAVNQFEISLQINPNQPLVLVNLAWVKATNPQASPQERREALDLALQLCRLTGFNRPHALDTLAAAYAAVGNFAEAVKAAERAIQLAYGAGQNELAAEIEKRLELYRQGRCYHQ